MLQSNAAQTSRRIAPCKAPRENCRNNQCAPTRDHRARTASRARATHRILEATPSRDQRRSQRRVFYLNHATSAPGLGDGTTLATKNCRFHPEWARDDLEDRATGRLEHDHGPRDSHPQPRRREGARFAVLIAHKSARAQSNISRV